MKNEMHDYYQTLGVSKSASSDEIKKAYRKKAQKYHPDLVAEDEKKKAKEEFQKVQQAYDVLKDPEKRKMYDQLGPDFERMGGGQPHPGGNPFGGGQGSFDFRDLFGQAPGGAGGGGGGFGFEDILRQFAPQWWWGRPATSSCGRRGCERPRHPAVGHDPFRRLGQWRRNVGRPPSWWLAANHQSQDPSGHRVWKENSIAWTRRAQHVGQRRGRFDP